MVDGNFLFDMTSTEVAELLKREIITLIPIGSIEGHGPHIPVSCDTFNTIGITKEIAKKAAEIGLDVLVIPPLHFGFSEWMDYIGVVSLKSDTFVNVIKDISRSLIRQGFKKLVFINGHGGNSNVLQTAVQDMYQETGVLVAAIDYFAIAADVIPEIFKTGFVHADEGETSIVLALGGKVHMDRTIKEEPKFPFRESPKYIHELFGAIHLPFTKASTRSKSGVFGDATLASEEKGRKFIKIAVDRIVEFLLVFSERD